MDVSQIGKLMAFMRRTYQALCFDLSGNLEKYSLELMQESKRICWSAPARFRRCIWLAKK